MFETEEKRWSGPDVLYSGRQLYLTDCYDLGLLLECSKLSSHALDRQSSEPDKLDM